MELFYDLVTQYPEDVLTICCFAWMGIGLLFGCAAFLVLGCFDTIFLWIRERIGKKSGKLTNEQRLELLEQKLDCIADIVISSSPEVK